MSLSVRRARAASVTAAFASTAAVTVAVIVASVGCNSTPNVSVVVSVPSSLEASPSESAWVELGLFEGACPPSSELQGGIPTAAALRFVRFAATESSPPLGDLAVGHYAVEAALRDSTCEVVAVGCTDVDLKGAATISVPLSATPAPVVSCGANEACTDGECLPDAVPLSGFADAGCALQVIGGGPLPDPMVFSGEELSSPNVTVVDGGFIVAYREYDPVGGNAQLTILQLDNGGGVENVAATPIGVSCVGAQETDGIGMTFDANLGLLASARPPCPGSGTDSGTGAPGGIDFVELGESGAIEATAFASSSAGAIMLADGHALSGSPSGVSFLAVLLDGVASTSQVSGLAVSPAASFTGTDQSESAAVASGADGIALLSAGADDAGVSNDELSLSIGPLPLSGSPPTGLATISLSGTVAPVTASDSRLFVLPLDPNSQSIDLETFDLPSGAPGPSLSLSAIPNSPLSDGSLSDGGVWSADVSVASGHIVVALAAPGAIGVYAFNGAQETPNFLSSVSLGGAPHVQSLLGLRDGAVVVGVSPVGAIVVWTTTRNVQPEEDLGGYAILGCIN